MIPITTSRLHIREYCYRDLKAIHTYAANATVSQYQAWGPSTVEETEAFLQSVLAAQTADPRMVYELAITLTGQAQLIGGIGLFLAAAEPQLARLGYILHPDYWGQGLVPEAGQAMITLARHLGLRRLQATCDARNRASRRVLEKLGLKLVHTIPNDYEQKGHWRTTLLWEGGLGEY